MSEEINNNNEFDDFDFVDHYGATVEVDHEDQLPENTATSALNCAFVGVGGGGAIATCGSDTIAYFTDTGTITL